MKKNHWMLFVAALLLTSGIAAAQDTPPEPVEANVWTTEEGVCYYKCPIIKGEGLVEEASAFSIFDGKKYYHCCASCQGPFRKNPQKWLSELQLPGNIVKVDEEGRKHFRDPVSSEIAVVEEKTQYVDYQDHRYFFISKKTKKQFEENPAEHLQKSGI